MIKTRNRLKENVAIYVAISIDLIATLLICITLHASGFKPYETLAKTHGHSPFTIGVQNF